MSVLRPTIVIPSDSAIASGMVPVMKMGIVEIVHDDAIGAWGTEAEIGAVSATVSGALTASGIRAILDVRGGLPCLQV